MYDLDFYFLFKSLFIWNKIMFKNNLLQGVIQAQQYDSMCDSHSIRLWNLFIIQSVWGCGYATLSVAYLTW